MLARNENKKERVKCSVASMIAIPFIYYDFSLVTTRHC